MSRGTLLERIALLESRERGVKRLSARALALFLHPEPHLAQRFLRMARLDPDEDVVVHPSGNVVRVATQETIVKGGTELYRDTSTWVD